MQPRHAACLPTFVFLAAGLILPRLGTAQEPEQPAPDLPAAATPASPEETPVSPEEPPASPDEQLKQYPTPTAEEAERFAVALGEVIYIPDLELWEGVIDWDAFMELSFAGIELAERSRAGFEEGFVGQMKSRGGILGQVHQALGENGTYELVRVHEMDGRQRALFRMLTNEGALNYHDYILIRDAQGRPRAVDFYVHLSGENFSTTVRRMIEQLAADEKRTFFDRLTGAEQGFLKNVQQLQEMTQRVQQGDAAGALEVYQAMPDEQKKDKLSLIQRYAAATLLPDEEKARHELEATYEVFRKEFPTDVCLDFMAIDYHIARAEYEQTLQAVDRLDQAIGGDGYLHELRGNIYVQAGQIDKATELFEKAVAALPERQSGYFCLIGVALEQKDFEATLAGLKRLDQAIEMQWHDLTEVPEYADFVASPYYKEWVEYLESR
jgi:tetratricopeptide (TPR) repeat protein